MFEVRDLREAVCSGRGGVRWEAGRFSDGEGGSHKNASVVTARGGGQECGPQSLQCRSRARTVFPPIYFLPVHLQLPALSATPQQPWKNGGNKTKKQKTTHLFMVPSGSQASATVFLCACGLSKGNITPCLNKIDSEKCLKTLSLRLSAGEIL